MTDQAQPTVDRGIGIESFDRVHGGLQHTALPGYRSTKPSTVVDTMPIIGTRTAYIVQSFRTEAHGFVISLEIMDARGPVRIILPNRVAQAIYRQRQSITDRSTPTSRAAQTRKAQREKARREKEARQKTWAERNHA
jgi:hypothetical protein